MSKKNIVHPLACVHPKAKLAAGVQIGPYTQVDEHVKIEADTKIGTSCVITGHASIGKRCNIFTGAVIGSVPQDLKYKGEKTEVIIGDDNVIREYVTVNSGTQETGKTVIGNKNLLMAYSHVAHDCNIMNETVIANVGTFAGHVCIEDKAVVGGMVAIHQFVRVGKLSIIGGCSKVVQDVPPFALVDGHPARVYGINNTGLKRAQVDLESVNLIKNAFKILFNMQLSTSNALEKIKKELPQNPYVSYLIEFIESSKRGVCKSN